MLDGDFDPQFLLLTTAIHVDLSGNLLTSSSGPNENFLPWISKTARSRLVRGIFLMELKFIYGIRM